MSGAGGGEGPDLLRQAVARLMDAHQEALEAADRVLEMGGTTDDDWTESAGRMEETLEDIRDILVGASEDVQDILGEDRPDG